MSATDSASGASIGITSKHNGRDSTSIPIPILLPRALMRSVHTQAGGLITSPGIVQSVYGSCHWRSDRAAL